MKNTPLMIFLIVVLSALLFGEVEDEELNARFEALNKSQARQEKVIKELRTDLDKGSTEIDSLEQLLQANSSRFEALNKSQARQEKVIKELRTDLDKGSTEIDSLEQLLQANFSRLDSTRTTIMDVVNNNRENFEGELQTNRKEMSNRTSMVLGIIAGILVLAALSYVLLRRKILQQGKQLTSSISDTRKAHDEEAIKLDNQLIELIGKQLDLFQRYRPETNESTEPDHTLVLKIANEIVRIQQNLDHMDENVKGHKQLSRATQSILNNLQTNGYEIPPLLGTSFDKNLNMIATMELDVNLAPGTSLIKRVVKPMVKYNGTMIQAAEVYVGFNDQ